MNKEKPKYYIIKDLDTGLYYRGKGQNRWGKYYNQASIFRNLAQANNSVEQLKRYDKSNAVAIEIEITEIAQNPTLLECIKEWEDAGYELINDYCSDFHFVKKIENTIYNRPIYHHFIIEKINGGRYFAYSSFEKDDNFNNRQYFIISFQEHNLIHKTLKALEVEND